MGKYTLLEPKNSKYSLIQEMDEGNDVPKIQAQMQNQSAMGFSGVSQDLMNMLRGIPGAAQGLSQWAKNELPQELKNYKNQPLGTTVPALAADVAQNVYETPKAQSEFNEYLSTKGILPEWINDVPLPPPFGSVNLPDVNFRQLLGAPDKFEGDIISKIGGGIIPALIPTGAFAPTLAKGAVKTAKAVPKAAKAIPGIAEKALDPLRPSTFLRGPLSKEQLISNLRAAEGTNTPLGNIIDSPLLKGFFENVSSRVPLSGGDKLTGKIANQVEQKAEDLLSQAGAGIPKGERNKQFKDVLEGAYEKQKALKNGMYKPVNELATAEGFTLELPSFRDGVNSRLKQIENSPLFTHDPDFKAMFNHIAKLKNPEKVIKAKNVGNNALMNDEVARPSIVEVNMTASKLYEQGSKLVKLPNSHDQAIGKVYLDLARRLKSDLDHEMKTRGSPELNQAYEAANTNYKENYSQFLDEDIHRLVAPDTEFETIINDIIKPGASSDKFTRIEKIQNLLPPEQRNFLGNAWLEKALDKEGELNPKQFAQLINKLGKRQFEALFPDPQYRQQLLDYGRLRGMNEKSLSRMANPMTGYSNNLGAQLYGQLGAAGTAAGLGHPFAALAALFGPQGVSIPANKLLTSQKVRDNLIKKMISREEKKK